MVEIDLKINGSTVFEYEAESLPRVGDYINISHEEINGEFQVQRVTHRVFQERRNNSVVSYVIVEAS